MTNITPLPPRRGEPETSPRRLQAKVRAAEAMRLRIRGLTYRQIAERLGYSGEGAAYNAVLRGLRDTRQEPAEELRTLELTRIDEALHAIWPRVLRGQTRAVDSFIKLSKRRADLLGLDAPRRIVWEDVRSEAAKVREQMVAAGLITDDTELGEILKLAEKIALGEA